MDRRQRIAARHACSLSAIGLPATPEIGRGKEKCRASSLEERGQGKEKLPRHIAFVMDGNRRWAKKRGLSLQHGYSAGMRQFVRFVDLQLRFGIPTTSFFALSIDNAQKRPKEEQDMLRQQIETLANAMETANAREGRGEGEGGEKGKTDDGEGEKDKLVAAMQRWRKARVFVAIRGDQRSSEEKAEGEEDKDEQKRRKEEFQRLKAVLDRFNPKYAEKRFLVNVAFHYDGKEEIVHAVRELLRKEPQLCSSASQIAQIDASALERHMWFDSSVPPPDVIVRPGNAPRLSGFLLWHSAYAEIYFTEKMWPDLDDDDDFKAILVWFALQKRNFGQ